MRVLITGANGFIATYLIPALLTQGHTVIATGKGECRLSLPGLQFVYESMDFTDPFAVHDVFEKYLPEIVVHAGAMSKPDDCEKDQWAAFVVNVEGTVTLLTNAAAYGSHFIFLSTDFIFDGARGMYNEDDAPGPVNYYGKTKLEAEEAVRDYEYDWAIVRTVLVYGKPQDKRGNILSVVKEKLEKKEEYAVFNDQVRTPTFAGDLAAGIVAMIKKKAKGIYHLSGEEVLTPYEMACRLAAYFGYDSSLIKKVTAAEFKQPAVRPLKTGFDISKAKRELGYAPVSFDEGLKKTFSSH
jgi:dTDP-4-dehydrorhamnose reductase